MIPVLRSSLHRPAVIPASRSALLRILTDLRPLDHAELAAHRWSADPDCIADEAMGSAPLAWIATAADGVPVYALGMAAARPGAWSLWGFGTPRWPEVATTVTRFARNVVLASFPEIGHRLDCACLAAKTDAQRWLMHLGAVEEATLRAFGAHGEDFKLYTYRPSRVSSRLKVMIAAWQREHGECEPWAA